VERIVDGARAVPPSAVGSGSIILGSSIIANQQTLTGGGRTRRSQAEFL
jgi:hypothetical protein